MEFVDRNFRLAVINKLMYEEKLIEPAFDVFEFVEEYQGREIDTDEEGYEIIPEVLEFFENLTIPEELLSSITELRQDGGDEVYMNIIPYWDGEDDEFNIKSAVDCKLLPNLKKITLFYDDDESILEEFEKHGVEARWL